MAKNTSKGVSLDPDDAVTGGGLFGAGTAVAKEHRFGMFDYNGKRKPVPALLVTFERDGEEHIESYTVGNGWKPSEDGTYLVPKAGQTGLNDNCKAMLYLAALRDECGMPKGTVSDDISVLDGIEGELIRKPLEKVEGSEKAGSLLVFSELEAAPWIEGSKKKKPAKKAKADDDANDDDDEDVKPAKKKAKPTNDDDDDDEPAPKKGAKKKAADDDEDDDADDELLEEAIEALITALDDGDLKVADVEGAVLAQVKKHPKRKAIAALAATADVLELERGWSFDAKKKIVRLG